MTVSAESFRLGMARVAAAVHLITTDGPGGRSGLTATAVCSVTDAPPTLLVCCNRRSRSNAAFKENGVLCVNTLSSDQREIAEIFAGNADIGPEDRFAHGDWSCGLSGAPVLRHAPASFDCAISDIQEHGTHTVLFCRILEVHLSEARASLAYLERQYHNLRRAERPPVLVS